MLLPLCGVVPNVRTCDVCTTDYFVSARNKKIPKTINNHRNSYLIIVLQLSIHLYTSTKHLRLKNHSIRFGSQKSRYRCDSFTFN